MKTMKKIETVLRKVILTIVIMIILIVLLYPIYEIIVKSFTDGLGWLKRGTSLKNEFVGFKNYINALNIKGVINGIRNSILRTVIGTLVGTVSNVMLAFLLSRNDFRYKKALTLFFVIASVVECGMIPRIWLYRKLGLTSNFWVYIIPNAVNVMYVLALKVCMEGLPSECEEAAYLDGAGKIRTLISVVMPQCKAAIAAVVILVASDQWNAWFDAMIYNRFTPEYTTLQYEIFKYLTTVYVSMFTSVPITSGITTIPVSIRMAMEAICVIVAVVFSVACARFCEPTAQEVMKNIKKRKE